MLFSLHMVMQLVTVGVIRPTAELARLCARSTVRAGRAIAAGYARGIAWTKVTCPRVVSSTKAGGARIASSTRAANASVRAAWADRASARHRRSRGAHARTDVVGLRAIRVSRPAELARTGSHHRR